MRATRAYITGFGTTGLLIAAAFMTLFVMSAYVAFNGFPGQDVEDPIGTLLLQEHQTPVSVPAQPVHASLRAPARSAAHQSGAKKAKHAPGPRASTGPVKQRVTGTEPASAPAPAPADKPAPVQTTTPQLPAATPKVPTAELPKVNLPTVQAPADSQLPVDTSGVTDLLSGL